MKKIIIAIITTVVMLLLIAFMIIPVFSRVDDSVDLGGGFYYVRDYPQCICCSPKPGKVMLPIGEKEEIVVRVQYNDSIIIATCSPSYYSTDSTIYLIKKKTGIILSIEKTDTIIDNTNYKEIKATRRYDKNNGEN